MQINLTTFGMDTVRRGLAEAPEVARRELLGAIRLCTGKMEAELKAGNETPGAMPVHTSLTRASIFSDAFSSPVGVLGVVASPAPVAAFLELGTRPHWVPWWPLHQWVEDRLGLTGAEANKATAGIQRKIARQGTPARHLFANTLRRNEAFVQSTLDAAVLRIALHLSNSTGGAA